MTKLRLTEINATEPYFQHLVNNGKKPLQAVCAVMRKLLHAIHGMLKHDQPFDNTRFYAIPATIIAD
jgi:hypothetical protein